ncbi:uncharacterized protein FOMMEDRAFT_153813 [Fomitiporia mediterranea MF3/22]|uniref:uncharacterized protein n=1 Tax=Fomitiporia mediterranea (strain MF3/22) TaxID=694068 RepID=UPI0004407DF2|nr:uncharacterized protein FOMMEDRAFT_153813 [Fomitiporia mediterranea MF3/22]EJD04737.1 hypothetical protein FOMMEDRAFT_153813 [Fomitiporia mediterranea MF3/22]
MLTLLYLYTRLDKGTVGGCINLDQSSKLEYLSLGGELLVEFDNEPILISARSVNLYEKFTAQQWRKILNAAPNLTKLRIAVRRELIEDEDRSVISHNLKYLELCGLTSHIVINNLTLPALRWLIYRDDNPRNGGEIFSTIIQRSLSLLNHLEIGGSCANEATVTLILPLLPQLEVLHLRGCAISARLFEVLSIPSSTGSRLQPLDTSNQILCSNLRIFSLCDYSLLGDVGGCADALCTMLESRWEALKLLVGMHGIRYPILFSRSRTSVASHAKRVRILC